MRLENAFQIHINISEDCISKQILHLSLQPLVENAVKHNKATLSHPLTVEIYEEDKWLIIRNNLQPSISETEGTGLGLTNLNERYKLQFHKEIEIFQTKEYFIVKLPYYEKNLHIVIIEDEAAARNLEYILKEINPEIQIVKTLQSIAEAMDWFTLTIVIMI
jgi:hypothetical protein